MRHMVYTLIGVRVLLRVRACWALLFLKPHPQLQDLNAT